MGAPEGPPLHRETQSLGQQMLNAPVGINGLTSFNERLHRVNSHYCSVAYIYTIDYTIDYVLYFLLCNLFFYIFV